MRIICTGLITLAIVLSGCASGIKHKDMTGSIPALQSNQGRIYFLRSSSMLGAALQPSIKLNGKDVGESKPGGFFFVDSKPGNQEVMCSTEVDKKLTFTLDKGETKYVKTSIGLGLFVGRVIPELVSQEDAQKELSDLSYTGTVIGKK
jgi:hypothetical protein